jgi:amino acid adenylation domain-containing protein
MQDRVYGAFKAEPGSLEGRIGSLSSERRALLEKLLRERQKNGTSLPARINRRSDVGPAPLSYAQQRLWFLDQLVPGNTVFNLSTAYSITGEVEPAVLELSLNEIVRRHEVLRTTFRAVNGEPLQLVSPTFWINLRLVDLRSKPASRRNEALLLLASEEAQRPFDLARGPLLRTTLVRLENQSYVFLLTIHHIISDAWSSGVFWEELTKIWDAFAEGKPSPLPQLPIQYADFAVWQRDWLRGPVLAKQLAYWREQLAGLTELQLPTDRPRPEFQSTRGSASRVAIPSEVIAGVRAISRLENATLFMTLLAAFQTLLFRYTGQEDIVSGTFLANRNRVEIEPLIGFFVNSLVLRTDFRASRSFREVLRQVRKMTIDGYANQDVPFARLVQELQPGRDPSRNPLFQVAFQLLNAPGIGSDESALDEPLLEGIRQTAILDLTLTLWESGGGLDGEIEYNTDLFEKTTIERMVKHYQTLLESVVADPDAPVEAASLLSAAERKQIIESWNVTAAEYPNEESLVSLFEAQAKRSPQAVALICEKAETTYRELNEHANQVANSLRDLGVKNEGRVGICMKRSTLMVEAMLATVKAGAAFVALDPAWPRERLAYMANDAALDVVLTHQDLLERLPEHCGRKVCMDDARRMASQCVDNLVLPTSPENIAYVIYTSGSTGRPKGVMGTHRGAVNRFVWMSRTYPYRSGEVCCARTSLSFVDSIQEIFGPLLSGVPNVIIPDDEMSDLQRLIETLGQARVTRIVLVPSMLSALLDTFHDLGRRLPDLKFWITSGEAITTETCQRFRKALPQASLINLYGSSEVAGDATCFEIPEGEISGTIPIGRPIGNVQVYIVDSHVNPVPVGVIGEMLIGGDALAHGYLNLPDLTAERFISNPFSKENGGKLFKTGDLAKYLPDGNIEFMGRADQQVKIRGFRVELGEVESVLLSHEGIRQAAAVVSQDDFGDTRLIAYVVQNPESAGPALGGGLDAHEHFKWKEIWDEIYRQESQEKAEDFNINGWNSSYTGLPIPAEEMREWVAQAVESVRDLNAASILEIGVGSGLLLFRLAPQCARYCGTDFSPAVLAGLKREIGTRNLSQVTLLERSADDFSTFEPRSFDAVVLNSVVQYFPSFDYLVKVLEGAVKVVRDGGSIFLGDIRNRTLIEVFRTSVELHRAPTALPASKLKFSVRKRLDEEPELVLDPCFFFALQQRLPEISHIRIEPKRGRFHNELTRYRYEVVMRVRSSKRDLAIEEWLDWKRDGLNLSGLRLLLENSSRESLGIANIPDARLVGEIKAWMILSNSAGSESAEDIRRAARRTPGAGVDPESLRDLAHETCRTLQLHQPVLGEVGSYHAVFRHPNGEAAQGAQGPEVPLSFSSLGPLDGYANDPARGVRKQGFASDLRLFLLTKLPEHMVPTAFVSLDSFPLTPSGKLDRRALPALDTSRASVRTTYTAPRTQTEEKLAEIWAQFLGIEAMGTHDGFFEMGGHSLLAIRVLSRMREAFNVDLPLRVFFENPTIARLAELLEEARRRGEEHIAPTIVRVSREDHLATLLPDGKLNPADLFKGRQKDTRVTNAGNGSAAAVSARTE